MESIDIRDIDFKNKIDVHCEKGSTNGKIVSGEDIYLTDNQAIYINDDEMIIFE